MRQSSLFTYLSRASSNTELNSGKQQYEKGGRAIKYVDSEMRIQDVLALACKNLKSYYKVQTVDGRKVHYIYEICNIKCRCNT